jgi:hypothetical protein
MARRDCCTSTATAHARGEVPGDLFASACATSRLGPRVAEDAVPVPVQIADELRNAVVGHAPSPVLARFVRAVVSKRTSRPSLAGSRLGTNSGATSDAGVEYRAAGRKQEPRSVPSATCAAPTSRPLARRATARMTSARSGAPTRTAGRVGIVTSRSYTCHPCPWSATDKTYLQIGGFRLSSAPLRSSDIAVDSRGFGRGLDSLPNDEDVAYRQPRSVPPIRNGRPRGYQPRAPS